MNRKLIMTTLGIVAGLWLTTAQAAGPNPQALGTWELDRSKSQSPPDSPGPLPKSVTRIIKDIGGGKWTMQVIVVQADGKKVERPLQTLNVTDGATTPVADNPQMDSITVSYPDADTLTEAQFKAGKQVGKLVAKLSKDGKQLVYDVDTTDKSGKPYHFTSVWNKK
jgi:hypothetical protein